MLGAGQVPRFSEDHLIESAISEEVLGEFPRRAREQEDKLPEDISLFLFVLCPTRWAPTS